MNTPFALLVSSNGCASARRDCYIGRRDESYIRSNTNATNRGVFAHFDFLIAKAIEKFVESGKLPSHFDMPFKRGAVEAVVLANLGVSKVMDLIVEHADKKRTKSTVVADGVTYAVDAIYAEYFQIMLQTVIDVTHFGHSDK